MTHKERERALQSNEWQRVGFGPSFFIPGPAPSGLRGPVPSCPKSETHTSIYNFSAQKHKHKHISKHDHKHKYRNPKHKCQIYDFSFQNHKPNTNFRSMIFPFKITNTNINSHWDELNPEKNGDRGGARPWAHGQGRWEEQRAVRQCEIGDGEDETKLGG